MTRDDFSDEEPEASIFGNAEVFIEKDTAKREWRVYSPGPEKQHLCTIPWAHSLKEWPHARDYNVAVKTCMANEHTALTEEEEYELMVETSPKAPEPEPEPEPVDTSNVIPFPRKRE